MEQRSSYDGSGRSTAEAPAPTADTVTRREMRHAVHRHSRAGRIARWVVGIAALLVVGLIGYVAFQYVNLDRGLNRSNALEGLHTAGPTGTDPPPPLGEMNILLMGLDSRLDMQGKELPKDIYEAMHTGDSSIGGMNTNVLMLLHLPADGAPATVIQIPRDDYVDFPDCPHQVCRGKIKEAYDEAFQTEADKLATVKGMSEEEKHLKARDAGRRQSIKTVEAFLGNGIQIDHFLEVTMVAFYEIAQVVQPITVCLRADTQDRYSGANFKAGMQQINAEQAVAFVRQRRDPRDENFSDLDRERRQQAFIAALVHQLKQKGTFANPSTLNGLINVAKKNIAVDNGLNLLEFAQRANVLTSGKVTFYTLPVKAYGQDAAGHSINVVDLPVIRSTVKSLLRGAGGATPTPVSPSSTNEAPKLTVNVVNASGATGAAKQLLAALVAKGYPQGSATTAAALQSTTVVQYAAAPAAGATGRATTGGTGVPTDPTDGADATGPAASAAELAALLGPGVKTAEATDVPPGTLRVVIGLNYRVPTTLGGTVKPTTPTTPTATPLTPSTVGTGAKEEDTSPTTLTALSGGGIPCVK